jgi:hypothetical protein
VHDDSIRTLIRIRPRLAHESEQPIGRLAYASGGVHLLPPTATEGHALSHSGAKDQGKIARKFKFSNVLGPDASQQDVFDGAGLATLVQRCVEGYNGTVFTYGQTGSGKTFTMDGVDYGPAARGLKQPEEQQEGVYFRVIRLLFAVIAAQQASTGGSDAGDGKRTEQQQTFSVRCSFLQIYNENVTDLLASSLPVHLTRSRDRGRGGKASGLRVRWSKRRQFYVENLFNFSCQNASECIQYVLAGLTNRTTASHKLNTSSSRSHSVFELYVDRAARDGSGVAFTSKLCMVDLAGSERFSMTGNTGAMMKQSIGINSSLFVLRKVIKSLAAGVSKKDKTASLSQHIPFRDSVLTRLLKHSLGGNCFTVMIACLCPLDVFADENVSTLKYAALASSIVNVAHVNEDDKSLLIRRLRLQIRKLKELVAMQKKMAGAVASSSSPSPVSSFPSSSPSTLVARPAVAVASSLLDRDVATGFLDSVSMVKTLLGENESLQQMYDSANTAHEKADMYNAVLNQENSDLRHRLALLEEENAGMRQRDQQKDRKVNGMYADPGSTEVDLTGMGRHGGSSSAVLAVSTVEHERVQQENVRLRALLISSDTTLQPQTHTPLHQLPPHSSSSNSMAPRHPSARQALSARPHKRSQKKKKSRSYVIRKRA